MKITILLLLVILAFTTNPGILIGVPLPYKLPVPQIVKLPIDIANFTVIDTQFTNIKIEKLDFNSSILRYKPRTLFIKQSLAMQITVKYMEAHFNFKYKGTYGPATYEEAGLSFKVQFNLLNKDGKIQIQIQKIEVQQGAIRVTLGGSFQERLISQITNSIIKYVAPFFYSNIKDAIKSKVTEINNSIKSQIPYLNINMDLSLINTPTFNSTYLTIGLNGASYINNKTGVLNPNDVLKPNVSQPTIQVLVHQDVLDDALKVYLQKNSRNYNISMGSVSGVADINSLTLSPIFPAMATEPIQDVILGISVSSSKVSFIPDFASVTANMIGNIFFKDSYYLNPTTGVLKVNGSLIYGEDKIAVDVDNIDIVNLNFSTADISAGRVYPEGWTRYQATLLRWLTGALDGILFSKPKQIEQFGIKLYLNGTVKTRYMEVSVVVI